MVEGEGINEARVGKLEAGWREEYSIAQEDLPVIFDFLVSFLLFDWQSNLVSSRSRKEVDIGEGGR